MGLQGILCQYDCDDIMLVSTGEVAERVLAKANEDYVKYFGDDDMCETPTSQPYMSSVF